MKKFFKGLTKLDKDGDSSHSSWSGVQAAMKGRTITEILKTDKKYEEMDNLSKNLNWFHAGTNRNLAETRLKEVKLKTGLFLVRPSLEHGNYVLSLVAKKTLYHYHIRQRGVGCFYIVEEKLFRGVDDLVNFYRSSAVHLPTNLKTACKGSAPPAECQAVGYSNILHQCIIENVTENVTEILAHPQCPNINAKNNRGNTALHEACVQGLEKVVQQLLEKGADPNTQQREGYTPLMLCCRLNKPGIICVLVEVGKADPQEAIFPSGTVALHEAARTGHMDCVKMLLSLKAPAWPRDSHGKFPHDMAITTGHKDIATYIDNFKALPTDTSRSVWYHGELSKQNAESIIRQHDCKDGVFLVRKSLRANDLYILVLSCDLRIYNYEIQTQDGIAYFIDQGPIFSSLEHIVEYYSGRADGLPTNLRYGIDPTDGREVALWGAGGKVSERPQAGSMGTDLSARPGPPCAVNAPTPRPPEPIKLCIADICIGREIGEGEYGAVYRGTWLSHEKKLVPVAIKTLHVRHASSRDDFLKEARVMVQLNHQNIVQLIGVCIHQQNTYLVQELVPVGSLLDYMLDYPERISVDPNLFLWASQVACGMSYLEEKQFVHRDLAARNILLKSKTLAKVGDFGLSRAISQGNNDYQASVGGRWPIKWYAPECVNYGTFTSCSDVWSFGVTLWEMFTLGEQPYGEKTGAQVITMVEHGQRLKRPKKCNDAVHAQMSGCWEYDPKKRPTFKDLENFFTNTYSYIPGIRRKKGAKDAATTSSPS